MQKLVDTISIPIGDVELAVPVETVTRLLLQKISRGAVVQSDIPRIGTAWHGGIYAGIARGREGAPDYHLIVGAENDSNEGWEKAKQWAAGLDGEWSLPFRAEQALMYGNVPELFKKEWYWSCEQYASGEACAWAQYFVGGYQYDYRKGNGDIRARAVRRFPTFGE